MILPRPPALFVCSLLLLTLASVSPLEAQPADAGSPTGTTAETGPSIPSPEAGQQILFDASTPDDVDRAALEQCFSEFSSDLLADYRVYVFSTGDGTRLDRISSLHDFADRAHTTFRKAGWYGGRRGVLLLLDVAAERTGVETGPRWNTAEFDSFEPSPAGLDYDSPAQQNCHLAETVEAKLGPILRRDDLGGFDDVRARLNLVERDLDHLDGEFEKTKERANGIAGPESTVALGVRNRLPTELRHNLQTQLEKIRRLELTEQDPADLRRPLEEMERKIRELNEKTYDTSSLLTEFKTAHRELERLDARVSRLEERLAERRRTQPFWLGADEAAAQLDSCRQKQRALRQRVESGKVRDRPALSTAEHCLGKVQTQIEASAPLSIFLKQFLPALLAILLVLGLPLLVYKRFRARSKLQSEIDVLYDQWQSALDYVGTRLRPLEQRHAEAFEHAQRVVDGEARPADADDDIRDIVDAATLEIALRRRYERAATARESAGWFGLGDLREVLDLMERDPITCGDYEEGPVTALDDAQARAERTAAEHGGGRAL